MNRNRKNENIKQNEAYDFINSANGVNEFKPAEHRENADAASKEKNPLKLRGM